MQCEIIARAMPIEAPRGDDDTFPFDRGRYFEDDKNDPLNYLLPGQAETLEDRNKAYFAMYRIANAFYKAHAEGHEFTTDDVRAIYETYKQKAIGAGNITLDNVLAESERLELYAQRNERPNPDLRQLNDLIRATIEAQQATPSEEL